jgi:polyisoprenoid-binding protein YceI
MCLAAVLFLAAAAAAAPSAFSVDEAKSVVRIHVGKAGAFSFAGHRHEITGRVTGSVRVDAGDPAASSVELAFPTGRLVVLPENEPGADAPKVQEIMLGPRVLDAARFPRIVFRSRQVSAAAAGAGTWQLQVAGDLSLHGVTRPVTVPMRASLSGDTLTATGQASLKQSDYGIEPVSAGAGTVRVKDELSLDFEVVARREGP